MSIHNERQMAVRQLMQAVASCSDLRDACGCLDSTLRRLIEFEEFILFLKEPTDSQVSCYSRVGFMCMADAFAGKSLAPDILVAAPGLAFGEMQELQLRAGEIGRSCLCQEANACLLLPLQGMRPTCGVLGLYFKDAAVRSSPSPSFLQYLATEVGSAIERVVQRERFARLDATLHRANTQLGALRSVSHETTRNQNLQGLIDGLSTEIRGRYGTEILCLVTHRPENNDLYWAALHLPDGQGPHHVGKTTAADLSNGASYALRTRKSLLADRPTIEQTSEENCISVLLSQGAQTYFSVPLIYGGRIIGVIVPAHVSRNTFSEEETGFWQDCASQVSVGVECLLKSQENQSLRNQISGEQIAAPYVIRHRDVFADIVGDSPALKTVFSQIEMVATTDSSVLVIGETGTGKGLVAQAIHHLSGRKRQPFVQINCAAIPPTLLESEMFGHERGAYTGAASRRIGRLEQAHGGTLFFDEIGEMPLELQPKLLRAVQEQRFERLGSGSPVQVNVRFVWATNRDLRNLVVEKQFRSDLYYRINVFPIAVPALRERVEDIPLLVHHFLREFNRRMNKNITRIPSTTMDRLMQREWPGNVRELRNVVERSAILSPGPVLQVCAEDILTKDATVDAGMEIQGWDEIERECLMRVLRETGGVVAWAASRLHLKRTTLDSRLRRLGISPEDLRSLRNR